MARLLPVVAAATLSAWASVAHAAPVLVAPNALVTSGPNTVVVAGARPGSTIVLAGSVSTNFTPFCPPQIAPVCLDLPTPSVAVGTKVADANGTAVFQVRPPFVPSLGFAGLQAVERRASGALLSNTAFVLVLASFGDEDTDGLSNGEEAFLYGTDPLSDDTDGGGETDGAEVFRGADPLDPSDDCGVALAATVPADGDVGVDVLATLLVDAVGSLPSPTFELKDAAGVSVPVTVATTAGTLHFEVTPTVAMAAHSVYTLTVQSACGASAELSFTTAGAHTPMALSALGGSTFQVDPFSGTLVQPAGTAALIQSLVGGPGDVAAAVLVTGTTLASGDAELFGTQLLATGGTFEQDACYPTPPMTGVTYDAAAGRFDIDGNVTLTFDGLTFDLTGEGTAWVLDGGAALGIGELSALLDVTPFTAALGLTPDLNGALQLCGLVASFGVPCGACPDGRPVCMPIEVRNQVWPLTVPTVPRSVPDPTCSGPTACGDGCSQSGPVGGLGLLGILLVGLRRRRR